MPNDPNSALAQLMALANGGGSITPYSAQATTAANANPYANFLWLGARTGGNQPLQFVGDNPAGNKKVAPSTSPTVLTGAPASQAELLPYEWLTNNKKKLQQMYAKASKATGTPVTTFEGFQAVWAKALEISQGSWAATQGGKTGNPLTPYDALDLLGREASAPGSGVGPHSNTTHSSSVEKLSSGAVWQVLQNAATQALGRAPTHNELRNFAGIANDIAVRNPTKTTTTTNYGADGSVTSSHSSQQDGAGAADYALAAQNATATPEAGAYQAATTYYNAYIQGLNSPV